MAIFERRLLSTRVARRLLGLFVLCALLPLTLSSWLSYRHVTRELAKQGDERLRQAASAAGLSVIERLMAAESELALLAGQGPLQRLDTADMESLRLLAGLAVGAEGAAPVWQLGALSGPLPDLDAPTRAFLDRGGTHLVVSEGSRAPLLIRRESPGEGLVAAVVRTDSLLATARIYATTELGRSLCILDAGGRSLACPHFLPDSLRARAEPARSQAASWQEGGVANRAWIYQIFLGGQFGAPAWTAIVSEPENSALAPLRGFTRAFVPTLLLALWSVMLLSNIQIRRTIDPLNQLQKGTERIANGDFDTRVEVRTKDEFRDLAEAFNGMASDLGTQFRTLDALHRLDRHALESSSLDGLLDGVIAPLGDTVPDADFSLMLTHGEGPATLVRPTAGGVSDRFDVHLGPSARTLLGGGEEHITLRSSDRSGLGAAFHLAPGQARALDVFPLRAQGEAGGCLIVERRDGEPLDADQRRQARQLADQTALGLWSVRRLTDLAELKEGALQALARTVDASSHWTAGHSQRVTDLSVRLAAEYGLSDQEIGALHAATLLHDIGKIGVPFTILNKDGKLTDGEFESIKAHPAIGAAILEPIAAFQFMLPVVRHHHERFDGRGYPDGLAGYDIPLSARIVAVADTFDALVSDRPYRAGKAIEVATRIIEEEAGAQFDPKVVSAFMRIYAIDLQSIVESHRQRALDTALAVHVPG